MKDFEILDTYVRSDEKLPWCIDLLNVNLDHDQLTVARERITRFLDAFRASRV